MHRRLGGAALAAGALALSACSGQGVRGAERQTQVASAATIPAATPAATTVPVAAGGAPTSGTDSITVYKDPNCGCCKKWVDYMRANGFTVTTIDRPDMAPVKAQFGVKPDVASCHTALVGGYVVEGHVPVEDVRRLLSERPKIAGLAVPGMPMGAPGMEMPGMKDTFDVVAFDSAGGRTLYDEH